MAQKAERIVEAIKAERLADDNGNAVDIGYNQGIAAALAAARESSGGPDPLRELAEWLVSKDWMLPELKRREGAPAELLADAITRARKALGKEG